MSERILVQINLFGPYVKKEKILEILSLKTTAPYNVHAHLLQQFFELPFRALSEEILDRYVEITTKDLHISIAPYTEELSERLLKPLKAAKKNYCLGDYPSTITLCGVVGEMLAILLWKINEPRLEGKPITEEDEKGLFGSTFEKLGQKRRLEILETFGYINEIQYRNFLAIKNSRRPYLHLWSVDLRNERRDALDTFKKAFQLFREITDIGIRDAHTVKVNPLLIKLFKNPKEKNEK